MLKHGGVDGLFVGANNLTDFLAVLEQDEGRHGAHAKLLRQVGHLVHVELVEPHARVLVGQFDNVGRDHLARAAPGRETVDEQGCWVRERRVEFVFAARRVSRVGRKGGERIKDDKTGEWNGSRPRKG